MRFFNWRSTRAIRPSFGNCWRKAKKQCRPGIGPHWNSRISGSAICFFIWRIDAFSQGERILMVSPSCRKPVEIVSAGEIVCARCGCDLTRLGALARSAASRLAIAKRALEVGCPREALRLAADSWKLRKTAAAARFACVAASASGERRVALDWLRLEGKLE